MKIAKFNLLKKLMNMTQSGSEAERLKAIDSANAILAESNTTWDRVLDRVIKVEVEIEDRSTADPASRDRTEERAVLRKRIGEAFSALESVDLRGGDADFVASLKDQWDRRGSLSPEQLKYLFAKAEKTGRFDR